MTGEPSALSESVVATYALASDADRPTEDLARIVAMEQSTGTWTKVPERPGSREGDLAAWVVDADEGHGTARVAFPLEIFEPANFAGTLSIIAGNLFGLGSLTKARLLDIDFPAQFTRHHAGPRFGVDGVRRLVGTDHEPRRAHAGTIIKPKVGLDPKGTAAVAKEAALGGLDFIKDDETLTDQAFCPLDERARLVLDALDQAYDETGHRTLYAVNVTAGGAELADRWESVQQYGANCVMIDVLTAGFDALATLRHLVDVPIHVHRAMHGAMTRSPDYGIDMLALCHLTRLAGGDQLHIGSASGKMEHSHGLEAMLNALTGPRHGLTTVFPVASGGLHPASVDAEVRAFGADVVVQAGGGVHGHPDGTRAGAHALATAVRAVAAGQRLDDTTDPALRAALEKWGGEEYGYDR